MAPEHPWQDGLLAQARAGDDAALGRLLEGYRRHLRLLAATLIGATLRVQLDPSDLVQETFLDAHRDFSHFAGAGEAEWRAWLRRILTRNLADQARRFDAQARDLDRHESLEDLLERSGEAVERALIDSQASPSGLALREEQAAQMADALARLPADYREVIVLRHYQGLPFEDVAQRMGKTSAAARKLWTRALEKLGRYMEGSS